MLSDLFTNIRRFVRLRLLSILALTVLVGSASTLAAPPTPVGGKTYCYCSCARGGNHIDDLAWPKRGACGLAVGKACKIKRGEKTISGKLSHCYEMCGGTGNQQGIYVACQSGTKAGAAGGDVRPTIVPAEKEPGTKAGAAGGEVRPTIVPAEKKP